MHAFSKVFHKSLTFLKRESRRPEFWVGLGFFVVLYGIFYLNTLHEKFPDEFDNILGGSYILRGKPPYVGFFSHHGPFAYFFSSIISLFSGGSFVLFRTFYSVILFAIFVGGYFFIRSSVGYKNSRYYLLFITLFAISATYFWGHMFVADSIAAVLLVPALSLIFLKAYYKLPFQIREFWFISILLACSVLTSLTFSYLIFGTYLFLLYLTFRDSYRTIISLKTIKILIILGIPYGVFLLYLLLTGSFGSYIDQSIIFNQKYYIYNYPRPEGSTSTAINPIRYAIIISYEFYKNFRDILLQVGSLNFNFPVNITFALANFFVLTYLLIKRKFMLFLFMLFILTFANARSNPLTSEEKDFQAAVYIILSLANGSFLIIKLWDKLRGELKPFYRTLYTVMFFMLLVYGLYATSFLFFGFLSKSYTKYMGVAPKIYDRPEIAPLVNSITQTNQTVWVGPLEFEELLYIDRPLPSRYHILIPGIGRSSEMTQEMISDFEKNKPVVIWLDTRYSILGQSPREFAPKFIEFLNNNYVTLYDEKTKQKEYESTIGRSIRTDLETMLFIRRDKYDEIVSRLLQNNYVKKVE